jgi:putative ABC transport system substrate-binding protein
MIRRREVITLLGGAAAWPLAARAQQQAMPVIGFLSGGSRQSDAARLVAFRRGLNETGYVEGHNVAGEYRWADHQSERLRALAVELLGRRATVIAAIGGPAPAVAAKAATRTVPIVFTIGGDPVKLGLVASLNRPGGNVTGVTNLANIVLAKQFEALHETLPKATVIGFLVNPINPNAATDAKEAQEATRTLGATAPGNECQHRTRHRRRLCVLCSATGRCRRCPPRCVIQQPSQSHCCTCCSLRAADDLLIA